MAKTPLLPQQDLMLRKMRVCPEAAIFASPGLGKTRATLEFIREWISDGGRGALIIAPLRVARLTWPAEIARWVPDLRWADLRTVEGREVWEREGADIYLVNNDYLQQLEQHCFVDRKELPVDILVLDELSKFKESSGKRYKSLFRHRGKFQRCIGLTGTPGGHLELFGQIKMLDTGKRLGRYVTHYKERFFWCDFLGYNFSLKEGAKEEIEGLIADMTITLRGEEYLDIPPVNFVDIDIALPPPVMSGYKKLQKEFLLELEEGEIVANTAAVKVNKLLQLTSGSVYSKDAEGKRSVIVIHDEKIKALRDLHNKLGKVPVLVMTQFVHERDHILEAFPYAEPFQEKRLDAWNRGEIPMIVADARSISLGLNLQGPCCTVIWMSLTYSSTDFFQANSRVARTGQKHPSTIYRIMATNTVDWAVAESLRAKQDTEKGLMATLGALRVLEKT